MAYQKDLCRVKELGPRGSVTQVIFLNNSDDFIFVSEGTCLVGAKQNRTFAKSFIAAPKTSIEVPVNCIERGRWENTRDLSFQPADYETPRFLRKTKIDRLRTSSVENIQGEIWEEVHKFSQESKTFSASEDLGEILKKSSNKVINHRDIKIDLEGANGFFLSSDEGSDIEIFGSSHLCEFYIEKLLNTEHRRLNGHLSKNTVKSAKSAISNLLKLTWEEYPSIGCETSYLTGDRDPGHSITHNNSLIHAVVYF